MHVSYNMFSIFLQRDIANRVFHDFDCKSIRSSSSAGRLTLIIPSWLESPQRGRAANSRGCVHGCCTQDSIPLRPGVHATATRVSVCLCRDARGAANGSIRMTVDRLRERARKRGSL